MRSYLIAIMTFLGCLISDAQTLDELIAEGLANNPEIKAYSLSYDRASEEIEATNTLPNTEFGVGYFVSEPETRTGPQRFRLSARQMLPWFGTIDARADYMEALAISKMDEIKIAEKRLILDISMSYFRMYEIQQKKEVVKENRSLLDTYETLALNSVEVGKASAVDVLKLQIRKNELDQRYQVLSEQYLSEQAALNKLLNREANEPIVVAEELGMQMEHLKAGEQSIDQHPELARYDNLYKSVEEAERLNQMDSRPMIGFGLDYIAVSERTDMKVPDNGKDILMPMLSVSVPVFNKKYSSASRQNSILQEELLQQKQLRYNMLETQMNRALRKRNTALISFQTQSKNIAQARDVETILTRSYEAGSVDFNEILDIQELQLKFQIEQIESVRIFNEQNAIIEYLSS